MKIFSAIFISFFLCFQIAFCQKNKIEISGFARIDHIFTIKYFDSPIISSRKQGLVEAKLSKKISEKFKLFTSLEFRGDLSDASRNRIFPKELYMDFSFKSLDFKLGKQKYYWGRADGINFTNNICSVDYSDFLDTKDEEIGQISLSTKYYLKNWTLQAVYIPLFSQSVLPNKNSIWNISLPSVIPNTYGGYFIPVYNYLPDNTPEKYDFKTGQYAFKLDNRNSIFDFSTSYYHGYSHLPEFIKTAEMINFDSIRINIQKYYFPKDIIGFDFASTIKKIGIKAEAAYFITQGEQAKQLNFRHDYIQYAAGIDYRKEINNNSFYFILQWMQEIVPSGFKYSNTSFNHIFQKAILARAEINSKNIISFSVQGLYDVEFKNYYLKPQVNYKIFDGVEFMIIADILEEINDKSIFGIYNNNDRIQMKVKYYF